MFINKIYTGAIESHSMNTWIDDKIDCMTVYFLASSLSRENKKFKKRSMLAYNHFVLKFSTVKMCFSANCIHK